MARLPKTAEDEVHAFLEVFNYFRWDYTYWRTADSSWTWYRGKASLTKIYDALVGRPSVGLKIGFMTRFFAFDIDVPGKKEAFGAEVYQPLAPNPTEKLEAKEHKDLSYLGDELSGNKLADIEEAMERLPKVVLDPDEVAAEAFKRRSLSPELKEAVSLLCGYFTDRPSLIVKSPHGVHVYFCLNEEVGWFNDVLPRLKKVKVSWSAACKKNGLDLKIEVKPGVMQPLRIPRKDRLIDVVSLEPRPELATVQELVDGIVCYPFETLFTLNAIDEGVARAAKENKARTGTRIMKKVKNRKEAERQLMPFRNGESNAQLIGMVEAGKNDGMKVAEILAWVVDWVDRSRGLGYTGDIDRNANELETRVRCLFDACWVAKASRFSRLWDEKKNNGIDEVIAKKALSKLQGKLAMAPQSLARVTLFLGQLDLWKKIIDEEVNSIDGEVDHFTRSNHARGVYPMPTQLLKKIYSGYREIWDAIQDAGLVIKDDDKAGRYIPDFGKPQYYRIEIDS